MGLYWVPGRAGVHGHEIIDTLTRGSSTKKFIRPEPPLGSLGKISIIRLHTGWITSIWCTSPATKTRLLSLIALNPGLLLAFLPNITPWEDIYYVLGWVGTPLVGSVLQRRKPQSMFCVSVRPWLHSDLHIWVPFFQTLRVLWTLVKEQGSFNLVSVYGAWRACLRPRCIGPARARTQILFYTIQHINT